MVVSPVFLSALAAVAFAAPPLGMDQKNAASCGQRPLVPRQAEYEPIIVGGHEVNPPFSYPWMCGLKSKRSSMPFCGSSLIRNSTGEYFLLTAAHCLDEEEVRDSEAICGSHRTTSNEASRQTLQLSRIIWHPDYNINTYVYDVAVIMLEEQPNENDHVQAVCLASKEYRAGETATVTGWGATSAGGPVSTVLLEISKQILSDARCQTAYGNDFFPSNMLCAGEGGRDSCQNDSGGPLVVERNKTWEQVGIVSWGRGCADPHYPGVYADVFAVKNWIEQIIHN